MPTPNATDKCIANCGRVPGGTPWLCLPCVRRLTRAWAHFHYDPARSWDITAAEHRVLNKVQKQSRKAYSRWLEAQENGRPREVQGDAGVG